MTRRTSIAMVGAALLSLSACSGSSGGGAARLPSAELRHLDGSTVDLASLRGPALVNIWSTTCTACVTEMPAVDAVDGRTLADGRTVEVIGLNAGEDADVVAGFLDDLGVGFDILLDPFADAQSKLHIAGLPTTLAIDADGRVVDTVAGALDDRDLDRLLGELSENP